MRFAQSLILIGIVLLGISLLTVLWLRASANELVRLHAPAVESSLRARIGLQRSLASLRGWVALGDPRFKYERSDAWKQGIERAIADLRDLHTSWPDEIDGERLSILERSLQDLKESQWWVEDVAQTEGNDRSLVMARRFVEPIAMPLRRTAEALRNAVMIADDTTRRRFADSANRLVDGHLAAEGSLARFLATGNKSSRSQFLIDVASVEGALCTLQPLEDSSQIAPYVRFFKREWPVYRRFALDAADARIAPDANVAVYLMTTETVPLTDRVRTMLAEIAERQLARMHEGSRFVHRAGTTSIILSVVLIVLHAILAYLLAHRRAEQITRPVIRLSAATRELASGVLTEDLPITTDDELGLLTAAFNKMRVNLARSQAALRTAHEKMTEELDQAADYVQSSLPERLSHKDADLQTDWYYIASSQLGGDLFNYYALDDHRTVIYLLDVSGHGIGSSLLSVSAHDTIRRHTLPNVRFDRPREVLAGLNAAFPMDENHGKFFTIWYGVYDARNRELTFATAGHHEAILIEPQDGYETRIAALGMPNFMIGLVPEADFNESTHRIAPGSRLYVFSDGAFEVRRKETGMLGLEGLRSIILDADAVTSESRLEHILNSIRSFQQASDFEDDYSMIEITFR